MVKDSKILLGLCLLLIFVPVMVSAQPYAPAPSPNDDFVGPPTPDNYYGIVGLCEKENDCGLQDLFNLFGRVFDFFIYLAVPLATLAIGYAGFLYLTSSTNEGNRSKAKEIIKNAIIGLVVALAAFVIVKSLLSLLGADPTFFKGL